MNMVIIETYRHIDNYADSTQEITIDNVYGPYPDDNLEFLNNKVIELENLRKSYNTSLEIMPLIKR